MDDWLAKTSMLHHGNDNIIPLFEEHQMDKELMKTLEAMDGPSKLMESRLSIRKFGKTIASQLIKLIT